MKCLIEVTVTTTETFKKEIEVNVDLSPKAYKYFEENLKKDFLNSRLHILSKAVPIGQKYDIKITRKD